MSEERQPASLATSPAAISAAAPAAGFAAAVVLFIGVASLPIGYYAFERWVVCAAAVLALVLATRASAGQWALLCVPTAVLWNPFIRVFMSRSAWLPLDLLTGVGFLAFGLWSLRRPGRTAA